ncbi:hypothetical protein [Acidovorax sp. Root217]|uniref:hypothetical protein n=1 Tax=Acidovorax sp. Root217 TaxID=1736492 RepID=UPI000709B35B|nr:hypothetical protein [Acidovorax sp. Root217]KRC30660.1 hypothetical protein ASE31_00280 [Acidovorax sp. Root217]
MRRVEGPAGDPTEATAPEQSPSLIVLTLRPSGQKFNGNVSERAEEAGFKYIQPTTLGYAHHDTGKEIARLVGARSKFLDGRPPEEIQVHIDPETCAIHPYAGADLFAMLERYAVLINGTLCDGLSKYLIPSERKALQEHIDTVMARRAKVDRLARTITMPDGERRELSDMFFSFTVRREAGSTKRVDRKVYFDVAPMEAWEGAAHAGRMVQAIVQGFKNHKVHHPNIRMMILEAVRKMEAGQSYLNFNAPSVANVTVEFLEIIEVLVKIGADNLNPKWLQNRIDQNVHLQECVKRNRAKTKLEQVENMRKGREAAAARRAAEGKA